MKANIEEKLMGGNSWVLSVGKSVRSTEMDFGMLEQWGLSHHYVLNFERLNSGVVNDKMVGSMVVKTLSGRRISVNWNAGLFSGFVSVAIEMEKQPSSSRWITEQVLPELSEVFGEELSLNCLTEKEVLT